VRNRAGFAVAAGPGRTQRGGHPALPGPHRGSGPAKPAWGPRPVPIL